MRWRNLAIMTAVIVLFSVSAAMSEDAFDHEYKTFSDVLKKHVKDGRVNYAALVLDRAGLDDFLKSMEKTDDKEYEAFALDQKRAYWINFHNAMILRIVIDHYPIKQADPFSKYPSNSPMNIQGAWTVVFFKSPVGKVNLNRIENEILPGLGEPNYLFAITSATKGGPGLAAEPLLPVDLSKRLDAAAAKFLKDPAHVKIDKNANVLSVCGYLEMQRTKFISRYFMPEQFKNRDKEDAALINLLVKYADPEYASFLQGSWFTIKWLPVDWSLNDVL